MRQAIVIEAMKGLPKPNKLKSYKPSEDNSDEGMDDEEGDKAARLSALEDFFRKGKAGDFEGADAAWSEYSDLCREMHDEE
jgi:hypothetical protein